MIDNLSNNDYDHFRDMSQANHDIYFVYAYRFMYTPPFCLCQRIAQRYEIFIFILIISSGHLVMQRSSCKCPRDAEKYEITHFFN